MLFGAAAPGGTAVAQQLSIGQAAMQRISAHKIGGLHGGMDVNASLFPENLPGLIRIRGIRGSACSRGTNGHSQKEPQSTSLSISLMNVWLDPRM